MEQLDSGYYHISASLFPLPSSRKQIDSSNYTFNLSWGRGRMSLSPPKEEAGLIISPPSHALGMLPYALPSHD